MHLPDENLLLVVHSLVPSVPEIPKDIDEYKETQQSLAKLCLVSRKVCAFSQPLLYRTFVKFKPFRLRDEHPDGYGLVIGQELDRRFEQESELDSDKESEQGSDQDCSATLHRDGIAIDQEVVGDQKSRLHTALEKFIRTLIQRPDLADRVECLRIESFYDDGVNPFNDDDDSLDLPSFDPALGSMFIKAMRKFLGPECREGGSSDLGSWGEWEAELLYGTEGVEVVLLLMLVPNLRFLHLEPTRHTLDLFVHTLTVDLPESRSSAETTGSESPKRTLIDGRLQSAEALQILPCLESLSVNSPFVEFSADKANLDRCVGLLTLPTLKPFVGCGLEDFQDQTMNGYEYLYDLDFAHLHHLKLEECFLESEGIRALVESCTNLQSLEIAFPSSGFDVPGIDIGDEFVRTLNKLSGSLERLSLFAPEGFRQMTSADVYDFSGFEKLRFFEMDEVAFVSGEDDQTLVRCLPRSLERFSIRNCNETIIPNFKALCSRYRMKLQASRPSVQELI